MTKKLPAWELQSQLLDHKTSLYNCGEQELLESKWGLLAWEPLSLPLCPT